MLSGQHNREPNADPDKWTQWIHAQTGKYPALWSADFLFQEDNIDHRWTMIQEAEKQWNNGAMISLLWHSCPPINGGEPCSWQDGILSRLTDQEWSDLITDGTPINSIWKSMVDEVAGYLQYLDERGVEVLWRPYHEMNQDNFWWGGRGGPDGTSQLFRMMYDRFTKHHGLSNLIWVWDLQDFSSLQQDLIDYNPGSSYWDVLALDNYSGPYSKSFYDMIVSMARGKPIAIGECAKLPVARDLDDQPLWSFFMAWSELVMSTNTISEVQELYTDARVITLDEMPGWQ